MSEFDQVARDAVALVKDLRAVVDELLVQLDLGTKEARDAAAPLIEKIEARWLEIKSSLVG
jgi:hypothetical protein